MKYSILRYAYIISIPSLWIVSLITGITMAQLSLLFATMTQSKDFQKWCVIQCSFESGDFTSPLTQQNKNYSGMTPNPRSGNRSAYGFAKYSLYIDCAIDYLQWYETYGKPVQAEVEKGLTVMSIPTIIQLLRNSVYIVDGDVPNYVANMPKKFLNYEDKSNLVLFAMAINIAIVVSLWYFRKKIKYTWLKMYRKLKRK